MDWYLGVFKKYAVFSGRARRTEYWMFVLFNILAEIVLTIVDGIIFGFGALGVLSAIYSLALIIPGLAVSVRRLHDIGKSGGWIFISLVPLIGGIWLLVLLCTAGTVGENKYGPDPKAA